MESIGARRNDRELGLVEMDPRVAVAMERIRAELLGDTGAAIGYLDAGATRRLANAHCDRLACRENFAALESRLVST